MRKADGLRAVPEADGAARPPQSTESASPPRRRQPPGPPPRQRAAAVSLQLFDVLGKTLELLEEHECAMRRDLEPLTACLARHVIVDADEMVLHIGEKRPIALVGAGGDLRL